MVLILIAPTYCIYLPLKSSLSEEIACLPHLTPAVVNEGERKGRQVLSEQPIMCNDTMGRSRNMKFNMPEGGLAVVGEGLCLSWCLSLVLRLMDG